MCRSLAWSQPTLPVWAPCSSACPRCKGSTNVKCSAMGEGWAWKFPPLLALLSCSCMKAFHMTLTACCPSVAHCLQLWACGGQHPYFLWSACIKSRGKGEFHHPVWPLVWSVARSVLVRLDPTFSQVHIYMCTHSLRLTFCRKIPWMKKYICMLLSGLIYSVMFYLVRFSPLLSFLPAARKVLHFSLLCLTNVFHMNSAGFWKEGLSFCDCFYFFFPLYIKLLKYTVGCLDRKANTEKRIYSLVSQSCILYLNYSVISFMKYKHVVA